MNAKPRWFRFGLRTLFVVVTAVGCWLGYNLHWIRQRHAMLKQGVVVEVGAIGTTKDGGGGAATERRPPAPGALWLFGEQGVVSIFAATQADAAEASRLFPEADVQYLPPPLSPPD